MPGRHIGVFCVRSSEPVGLLESRYYPSSPTDETPSNEQNYILWGTKHPMLREILLTNMGWGQRGRESEMLVLCINEDVGLWWKTKSGNI